MPDPPTDITIDWTRSSKTSLAVNWVAPSVVPSSPITGYTLEMDDGNGGQFTQIYDGSQDSNALQFLIKHLTNGLLYRFRVYAVNFNGKSLPSTVSSYYACQAPTDFQAPKVVFQNST